MKFLYTFFTIFYLVLTILLIFGVYNPDVYVTGVALFQSAALFLMFRLGAE